MPMYQLHLFPQNGKIYIVKELSRTMKYPLKDLKADFPDEESCLEWLINYMYPDGVTCLKCKEVTKHYKDKGRRSYSCSKCGNHFHPTAGTIFHNSHVPLTDWFHAIWLMSSNKAGTNAVQIQRELGVSYRVAWRTMHQIRLMMATADDMVLGGEGKDVEIDEMFWHPNPYKRTSVRKRTGLPGGRHGQVVVGMVQRDGPVKVWHVKSAGARVILPLVMKHVAYYSTIHTDGYRLYRNLPRMGFEHKVIDHGSGQYWSEDAHTQNIENFWSTVKPRLRATFKGVSPKHLQKYMDEFAWRYSHRKDVSMFWSLMDSIKKS